MTLFLAAIAAFLFIRVLGARDASLGAVVTKGGRSRLNLARPRPDRPGRRPSAGPTRRVSDWAHRQASANWCAGPAAGRESIDWLYFVAFQTYIRAQPARDWFSDRPE